MANLADLFDSAAARALDAQASALAAESGWGLMAQAGQAAWQCLLQHWPQARRIGVVVGAGNNGGDGHVLARHAPSPISPAYCPRPISGSMPCSVWASIARRKA